MLLVEYTLLDNLQIINESTGSGGSKLKLRGRFQKCDEQNNNGRIYPRKILESQVQKIQEKINDRSLVGALDHPANDAIHLSQASHLITGLSVDKSGDVTLEELYAGLLLIHLKMAIYVGAPACRVRIT